MKMGWVVGKGKGPLCPLHPSRKAEKPNPNSNSNSHLSESYVRCERCERCEGGAVRTGTGQNRTV